MGRRPKEGRPKTEEVALAHMREAAQELLVVPGPHATAEALGKTPATIRSIYRRLVETGDLGQTEDGVYYLPIVDAAEEG